MTVCSGIGAAEVAAPWIEWRWQSEIEPFPTAVLRHRFPDAVNVMQWIFDRIRMVEQINGQGQQEEGTAAEAGTGNRTVT